MTTFNMINMCTWSCELRNDDVNSLFPKNSSDTMFQDKKVCRGNWNAYNDAMKKMQTVSHNVCML